MFQRFKSFSIRRSRKSQRDFYYFFSWNIFLYIESNQVVHFDVTWHRVRASDDHLWCWNWERQSTVVGKLAKLDLFKDYRVELRWWNLHNVFKVLKIEIWDHEWIERNDSSIHNCWWSFISSSSIFSLYYDVTKIVSEILCRKSNESVHRFPLLWVSSNFIKFQKFLEKFL